MSEMFRMVAEGPAAGPLALVADGRVPFDLPAAGNGRLPGIAQTQVESDAGRTVVAGETSLGEHDMLSWAEIFAALVPLGRGSLHLRAYDPSEGVVVEAVFTGDGAHADDRFAGWDDEDMLRQAAAAAHLDPADYDDDDGFLRAAGDLDVDPFEPGNLPNPKPWTAHNARRDAAVAAGDLAAAADPVEAAAAALSGYPSTVLLLAALRDTGGTVGAVAACLWDTPRLHGDPHILDAAATDARTLIDGAGGRLDEVLAALWGPQRPVWAGDRGALLAAAAQAARR